ncbi:p110_4L [African swine fever virus]|uniref:p110_4L n=1 Tax=African swine fever virus TaxID=10497 RepID=A0A6G7KUC8_ASF|nr:p110_4L [African swine fever virus]
MQIFLFICFPYQLVWTIVWYWIRTIHIMVLPISFTICTLVIPARNLTRCQISVLNIQWHARIHLVLANSMCTFPAKLAAFHICAPVSKFFLWRIIRCTKMSSCLCTYSYDLFGQQAKNSQEDHQ